MKNPYLWAMPVLVLCAVLIIIGLNTPSKRKEKPGTQELPEQVTTDNRNPAGKGSKHADAIQKVKKLKGKASPESSKSTKEDPVSEEVSKKVNQIYRLMEKKKWEEAGELISKLPEGQFKNTVMSSFVCQWAQDNVEDALQWAKQLSNENERNKALAAIVPQLASKDPIAAAKLAEQLPQEMRKYLLINV